jgi:hypothetical protein
MGRRFVQEPSPHERSNPRVFGGRGHQKFVVARIRYDAAVVRTEFSRAERERQSAWRRTSTDCAAAGGPGSWRRVPCDFILPVEHAELNLWAPIRDEVRAYFRANDVAWHDGDNEDYGRRAAPGPSPHLLDSQVCAVNFWWGLARWPAVLAAVLRSVFADVEDVVAVSPGEPLVVPEWIGRRNYLGERGSRRRGAYATSADFLVVYVDAAGGRHGLLLESKYTESYEPERWRRTSERGTDRAAIYRAELERPDGPLRDDLGVGIEDLLIEPFDQHLRQQLLARAMEREGESDLRTVTCFHVSPRSNTAFHEGVTSPRLAARAATVGQAWRSLLRDEARYVSAAYEDLFARAAALDDPALAPWVAYQRARYPWAR